VRDKLKTGQSATGRRGDRIGIDVNLARPLIGLVDRQTSLLDQRGRDGPADDDAAMA
jgi:hypothetical protein